MARAYKKILSVFLAVLMAFTSIGFQPVFADELPQGQSGDSFGVYGESGDFGIMASAPPPSPATLQHVSGNTYKVTGLIEIFAEEVREHLKTLGFWFPDDALTLGDAYVYEVWAVDPDRLNESFVFWEGDYTGEERLWSVGSDDMSYKLVREGGTYSFTFEASEGHCDLTGLVAMLYVVPPAPNDLDVYLYTQPFSSEDSGPTETAFSVYPRSRQAPQTGVDWYLSFIAGENTAFSQNDTMTLSLGTSDVNMLAGMDTGAVEGMVGFEGAGFTAALNAQNNLEITFTGPLSLAPESICQLLLPGLDNPDLESVRTSLTLSTGGDSTVLGPHDISLNNSRAVSIEAGSTGTQYFTHDSSLRSPLTLNISYKIGGRILPGSFNATVTATGPGGEAVKLNGQESLSVSVTDGAGSLVLNNVELQGASGSYLTYDFKVVVDDGYGTAATGGIPFYRPASPLLTGIVRDRESSAPLSGAQVTVETSNGDFVALTNAEGRYSIYLENIRDEVVTVVARAEHYRDWTVSRTVFSGTNYVQDFALTPVVTIHLNLREVLAQEQNPPVPEAEALRDYSFYQISAFSEKSGTKIDQRRLEGNILTFPANRVTPGDKIRVEVKDSTGFVHSFVTEAYQDFRTPLEVSGLLSLYGHLTVISEDDLLIAFYSASGTLQESKWLTAGQPEVFRNLPPGDYTAITMTRYSDFLHRIDGIAGFKYNRYPITLEPSVNMQLAVAAPPTPERHIEEDSALVELAPFQYSRNVASSTLTISYTLREDLYMLHDCGVSLELYATGAMLFGPAVIYDGETGKLLGQKMLSPGMYGRYTLVVHPVGNDTHSFKILLGAHADRDNTASYVSVDAKLKRENVSEDLGSAAQTLPMIEINTRIESRQGIVDVSGVGRPGQEVEIFDQNNPIGTATVDAFGRWSAADLPLHNPKAYSVHYIYATTALDGEEYSSKTVQVTHMENISIREYEVAHTDYHGTTYRYVAYGPGARDKATLIALGDNIFECTVTFDFEDECPIAKLYFVALIDRNSGIPGAPTRLYLPATSDDGGKTWTARDRLSTTKDGLGRDMASRWLLAVNDFTVEPIYQLAEPKPVIWSNPEAQEKSYIEAAQETLATAPDAIRNAQVATITMEDHLREFEVTFTDPEVGDAIVTLRQEGDPYIDHLPNEDELLANGYERVATMEDGSKLYLRVHVGNKYLRDASYKDILQAYGENGSFAYTEDFACVPPDSGLSGYWNEQYPMAPDTDYLVSDGGVLAYDANSDSHRLYLPDTAEYRCDGDADSLRYFVRVPNPEGGYNYYESEPVSLNPQQEMQAMHFSQKTTVSAISAKNPAWEETYIHSPDWRPAPSPVNYNDGVICAPPAFDDPPRVYDELEHKKDTALTCTSTLNSAGGGATSVIKNKSWQQTIKHGSNLLSAVFCALSVDSNIDTYYDLINFGDIISNINTKCFTTEDMRKLSNLLSDYSEFMSDYESFAQNCTIIDGALLVVSSAGGLFTGKLAKVSVGATTISTGGGGVYGFIAASEKQDFMERRARMSRTYNELISAERNCPPPPPPPGSNPGGGTRVVGDPSGIVYAAVLENPVANATATLWYADNASGTGKVIWDACPYEQINPQLTTGGGGYEWYVPEGFWQVQVEKSGYKTAYSEWMEVFPPRTNVNINLLSTAVPQLVSGTANNGALTLTFDMYMDTQSLRDAISCKTGSNPVSFDLVPEENSSAGKVGKVFVLTPKTEAAGDVAVTVSAVAQSYAGVALGKAHNFTLRSTGGNVDPTDPVDPVRPDDSGSDSSSGQRAGGINHTAISGAVTMSDALSAYNKAFAETKASGGNTVHPRFVDKSEIGLDVLKSLSSWAKRDNMNIEVWADQMNGGVVALRLYIDLGKAAKPISLLASHSHTHAIDRLNLFKRFFKNKMVVIHTGQAIDYGMPVKMAVKLDFTGWDTDNLHFYSYDSKTNTYKRIEKPAYWMDSNGYLRFTTELAGDIIISERPLEKK